MLCFNDKQIGKGNPVYLSIRPEKFNISREEPAVDGRHNKMRAHVEDVIYLGTHTKYWVRIQDYRLAVFRQHSRFLLDEKPIRWREDVWITWHADDGFMLERYSESDETAYQSATAESWRKRSRGQRAGSILTRALLGSFAS